MADKFCKLLGDAIKDEDKAFGQEYVKLADVLYKESDRVDEQTARDHATIVAIRGQEGNHFEMLKEIFARRCR